MKPITLHFSESLMRRVVRSYWWGLMPWKMLVVGAVLMLGAAIEITISKKWSWPLGLFLSVPGTVAAMAVAKYVYHMSSVATRFRRLKSLETTTLEIGEERFRLSSTLSSSEFHWSTVTEIWQFRDFWLVFFSRAQFITLPLADLDSEAREMFLSRVCAHGAKIR